MYTYTCDPPARNESHCYSFNCWYSRVHEGIAIITWDSEQSRLLWIVFGAEIDQNNFFLLLIL